MNRLDAPAPPPPRTTVATSALRSAGRALGRLAALGVTSGFLVVGVAGPAAAHVTVEPSTTEAGAYAVLEFSVSHGCGDAPTTGLTVQIPPGINAATPTRDALWKAESRVVDLDPPATDAHGNEVTQRVESVTFTTREPLVDGLRDTVQLSVQLPEAADGSTLVFPVIQRCEGAESAWIEVPGAGLDEDDLELPAPSFTVTAADPVLSASAEPAADARSEGEADADAPASPASSGREESGPGGATLLALVAGALGMVLGGAALVQHRRPR